MFHIGYWNTVILHSIKTTMIYRNWEHVPTNKFYCQGQDSYQSLSFISTWNDLSILTSMYLFPHGTITLARFHIPACSSVNTEMGINSIPNQSLHIFLTNICPETSLYLCLYNKNQLESFKNLFCSSSYLPLLK